MNTGEVREKTIRELVDEKQYDLIEQRIKYLKVQLQNEEKRYRQAQEELWMEKTKVKALTAYIVRIECEL